MRLFEKSPPSKALKDYLHHLFHMDIMWKEVLKLTYKV